MMDLTLSMKPMEILITVETDKTAMVPINSHTYLPLKQTLFTRRSIQSIANADTAIRGEIHSSFAVSITKRNGYI